MIICASVFFLIFRLDVRAPRHSLVWLPFSWLTPFLSTPDFAFGLLSSFARLHIHLLTFKSRLSFFVCLPARALCFYLRLRVFFCVQRIPARPSFDKNSVPPHENAPSSLARKCECLFPIPFPIPPPVVCFGPISERVPFPSFAFFFWIFFRQLPFSSVGPNPQTLLR